MILVSQPKHQTSEHGWRLTFASSSNCRCSRKGNDHPRYCYAQYGPSITASVNLDVACFRARINRQSLGSVSVCVCVWGPAWKLGESTGGQAPPGSWFSQGHMRNMRPFQAQQAAASSAETSLTPRRISYGFGASHRVGVNLAAVSICALGSLHSPTQDHPIVMLLTGYNSGGERGDRGRERGRERVAETGIEETGIGERAWRNLIKECLRKAGTYPDASPLLPHSPAAGAVAIPRWIRFNALPRIGKGLTADVCERSRQHQKLKAKAKSTPATLPGRVPSSFHARGIKGALAWPSRSCLSSLLLPWPSLGT